MKAKLLFGITAIFFISLQLYWSIFRKSLIFHDIQDGQIIRGSDFVYDIQLVETMTSAGITIEQRVIYLVNQKTDNRFKISLAEMNSDNFYFSETKDGVVCHHCVDIIHSKNGIYLITSRNSGGSGGYYIHEIFEIFDDHVEEVALYLSCRHVYLRNTELVFPSRKYKCPQLLPDFNQDAWEYETFDLSESLSYVHNA